MRFDIITIFDVDELAKLYVDSFNTPPWNDEWTMETAAKTGIHRECKGNVAYDQAAFLFLSLNSKISLDKLRL